MAVRPFEFKKVWSLSILLINSYLRLARWRHRGQSVSEQRICRKSIGLDSRHGSFCYIALADHYRRICCPHGECQQTDRAALRELEIQRRTSATKSDGRRLSLL